eukprot:6383694-Pyramimonas_sp.AAC.1
MKNFSALLLRQIGLRAARGNRRVAYPSQRNGNITTIQVLRQWATKAIMATSRAPSFSPDRARARSSGA